MIIGLLHEYATLHPSEMKNLFILRKRLDTAPKAKYTFWDDYKDEMNPDAYEAIISGKAKFLGAFITNVNMATVRYINFCQKIEDKYKQHPADFLNCIYADGGIEFEMDGWHP